MNTRKTLITVTALLGMVTAELPALEVDREVMPRVTLGGRVISTFDYFDLDTDPDAKEEINLSDSSLLMRFDKRLYRNGLAGGLVGFKEN